MRFRTARVTDYGDGLSVIDELETDCNSHCSPYDLVYARSHTELAGRKDRPLNEGVSLREPLNLRDWWNWE